MAELNPVWLLVFALSAALGAALTYLLVRQRPAKVVRLPVVRECGTCKHFDLQAGQDAIVHHPAFAQASNHLSPQAMGRTAKHDDAGGVIPGSTGNGAARWDELGACLPLETGVFEHCTQCMAEEGTPDMYEQASLDELDMRTRRAAGRRVMPSVPA